MASLMLINPRKRRAASKRRTRRNPVAKRAAPKRNPARRALARRANPLKTYRRRARARRNPIGLGGITATLTNAAIGGAGAVAVDYALEFLPLPVSMKTGWTGVAVKGAIAVGVGMIGKKFLGRNAEKMAEGALSVLAYSSIKGLLAPSTASVAGLGYGGPAQIAGNATQLSEYLNSDPFAASGMSSLNEYVQY